MRAGKRCLVLVPGLLCTAHLFAAQRRGLAGRADIAVAEHTGFASLEQIAGAILAAAPPRFALAGLSMGGYIAFEMLRQAPERVTHLALIDTNARADRPEQAAQRRALVALARAEGLEAAVSRLWPFLVHEDRLSDRRLRALVLRMAVQTGIEAFARQQQAIVGRPDNRPFPGAHRLPDGDRRRGPGRDHAGQGGGGDARRHRRQPARGDPRLRAPVDAGAAGGGQCRAAAVAGVLRVRPRTAAAPVQNWHCEARL
jgi:pimeloyl-ACP methyl ester carboxylesterase